MPLTPQQEKEIYPLLDKVSELDAGQGILYKCSVKRADYLVRMIQGLRYDSAIESIEMYPPGHPLHGQGLYADLWVEAHDQGLLATKLPQPHDSVVWRFIQCAATQQPVPLSEETSYNYARTRLARAQKKYPSILNNIYITNGEPIMLQYGEPQVEEMVVVDIDVNPGNDMAGPTAEQRAASNADTPHRKSR